MKRILSLTLALIMLLIFLASCVPSMPEAMPEEFSFSITWGTFGESSYDSKTGTLVKTKNGYPLDREDYMTTCVLSKEEMETIYVLIRELDIEEYPDEFDLYDFQLADPYMTLSLTVHTDSVDKTVTAKEVGSFDTARTVKAKKYLDVIKEIIDIMTAKEEWKAIPDSELEYD